MRLPGDVMARRENVTLIKDTPGIIVLNPGQMLYSHKLEKNISFETWRAMPKANALEVAASIHPFHNRVPGHKNPQEHINTVLEHIIPQLTREKTRIWVIAVSDGAEHFINYMNARLSDERKMILPGRPTKGMGFINPTHDPEKVGFT